MARKRYKPEEIVAKLRAAPPADTSPRERAWHGFKLGPWQSRINLRRDKERALARENRRAARGKGLQRGASFPGTAEHPLQRKQVFAAALKRVSKEIGRMRKLEARAAHVEAARRAGHASRSRCAADGLWRRRSIIKRRQPEGEA